MESYVRFMTLIWSRHESNSAKLFQMLQGNPNVRTLCFDNAETRKRVQSSSNVAIKYIPTILAVYNSGKIDKFETLPELFEMAHMLVRKEQARKQTQSGSSTPLYQGDDNRQDQPPGMRPGYQQDEQQREQQQREYYQQQREREQQRDPQQRGGQQRDQPNGQYEQYRDSSGGRYATRNMPQGGGESEDEEDQQRGSEEDEDGYHRGMGPQEGKDFSMFHAGSRSDDHFPARPEMPKKKKPQKKEQKPKPPANKVNIASIMAQAQKDQRSRSPSSKRWPDGKKKKSAIKAKVQEESEEDEEEEQEEESKGVERGEDEDDVMSHFDSLPPREKAAMMRKMSEKDSNFTGDEVVVSKDKEKRAPIVKPILGGKMKSASGGKK
jgi:hypothetical protein